MPTPMPRPMPTPMPKPMPEPMPKPMPMPKADANRGERGSSAVVLLRSPGVGHTVFCHVVSWYDGEMRIELAIVAVAVACGSADPEAEVRPEAALKRAIGEHNHVMGAHPVVKPPRCAADSECVALDVFCGGRSAEHVDVADEVLRFYIARSAVSNCEVVPWAVAEHLEPHCSDGACQLRILQWADHAGCEGDDACTVLRDPCLGRVAVEQSEAQVVVEEMLEPERLASCASRQPGMEVGSPSASCRNGYCRIDE